MHLLKGKKQAGTHQTPLPSIALVKRPPLYKGIYPPRLSFQPWCLVRSRKHKGRKGKRRERKFGNKKSSRPTQHDAVNTHVIGKPAQYVSTWIQAALARLGCIVRQPRKAVPTRPLPSPISPSIHTYDSIRPGWVQTRAPAYLQRAAALSLLAHQLVSFLPTTETESKKPSSRLHDTAEPSTNVIR